MEINSWYFESYAVPDSLDNTMQLTFKNTGSVQLQGFALIKNKIFKLPSFSLIRCVLQDALFNQAIQGGIFQNRNVSVDPPPQKKKKKNEKKNKTNKNMPND